MSFNPVESVHIDSVQATSVQRQPWPSVIWVCDSKNPAPGDGSLLPVFAPTSPLPHLTGFFPSTLSWTSDLLALWGAARYQARNNAQELTLKQCDFPRLVDFRSNKHLVGISYGGFLIYLVDGIFSLNTSLAGLNISEVWTGVPLFKKSRNIKR